MMRLVYVMKRLPGMSRAKFLAYWRDIHGPLVAKHSTHLRIRRYIQSHTQDDPLNDLLMQLRKSEVQPFDGVEDLWWDSEDTVAEAFATAVGQEAWGELIEDERQFVDIAHSAVYWAAEVPVIFPCRERIIAREESPVIKIFGLLFTHRAPDEARIYWTTGHNALARSVAAAGRLSQAMQVPMVETDLIDLVTGPRVKIEGPFLGHVDLWYDRLDMMGAATTPEGLKANEVLSRDEEKFVDPGHSCSWITKEHVFIDR